MIVFLKGVVEHAPDLIACEKFTYFDIQLLDLLRETFG
jgi:hypothetical protein